MSKKETLLQKAQDLFEYAKSSKVRKDWEENYKECKAYYEGDQWHDEDLNANMKELGISQYTFNNIEHIVNLYTSLQIRSGKRAGFELKHKSNDEKNIIQPLQEEAYLIHTESDYSYYSSKKFTDMLIGGIGWSTYTYKNEKLRYETIEPSEIFFDPDDTSIKLDRSNFICRSYYKNLHEITETYPNKTEYFNDLVENTLQDDSTTEAVDLHKAWVKGKTVRIVEIQYKKLVKAYKIKLINKEREFLENFKTRSFIVFDLEELDKIDIDEQVEIKEIKATRIYRIVYTDEVLLEHSPIELQVPNQGEFSYIPVILRRDTNNVPYGIVNRFISIQNSRNHIWSTLLHYMDAKTLIANLDSVPQVDVSNLERIIKKEMRKKNGVIITKSIRDYQVVEHNKTIQEKIALLKLNSEELEKLSGLYNTELSGTENTNMSGVAINMRSVNTMNAQNFMLLAYNSMIISEGKSLLNSIQGIVDLDIEVLYKEKGTKVSKYITTLYRTLSFGVYSDSTSNFATSAEETRVIFNEILNSPSAHILLQSTLFLEMLGVTPNSAYDMVKEYEKLQLKQQVPPSTADIPTNEDTLNIQNFETNRE